MTAVWSPQLGPQADAISATWCDELFFGGARGGGKSDFLLGDYLQDVEKYQSHWQGILFRRTFPELDEIIRRSHEIYPQTGAQWLEGKARWQWPNGARLKFRQLERDIDAEKYRGHQYPWIAFDELDSFPSPVPYFRLRACNRWAGMPIPTKRMRSAGNPGGVGSGWIKALFIDHNILGFSPRQDPATGRWIMFIPSKLSDNRILMENDPNYINSLRGVGSPALVKAWLEGDFSVIVGAYFDIGPQHIVQPFAIPEHWTKFRAMDWGSMRPFCVLYMTLAGESLGQFPRNSLIVYREWYGASAPNVGLKMSVPDVARGILARTPSDEVISYTVCDPSMEQEDGGPSIAERMGNYGVPCFAGDNKRIPGWTQIRDRLTGEDGKPMLYFVGPACPNLVRTLPALQHDAIKAEDLDTEAEDHAADALRYGCMSRPYTPPLPKDPEPLRTLKDLTYGELKLLDKTGRSYQRI